MLLQGLVLALQVKISVHQCLVGVVHGLQISVFSSLIDFEAVVLGFEGLQMGRQLVGSVVLLAVGLELVFLLLYKAVV